MNLLNRVKQAQELWRVLIPFAVMPESRQFALWVNRFDEPVIERAFWRASKRFSPDRGRFEPSAIHKYCTGVMLNCERENTANAG